MYTRNCCKQLLSRLVPTLLAAVAHQCDRGHFNAPLAGRSRTPTRRVSLQTLLAAVALQRDRGHFNAPLASRNRTPTRWVDALMLSQLSSDCSVNL